MFYMWHLKPPHFAPLSVPEKPQFTNIRHLADDRYYKYDCSGSMKYPSQKSAIN